MRQWDWVLCPRQVIVRGQDGLLRSDDLLSITQLSWYQSQDWKLGLTPGQYFPTVSQVACGSPWPLCLHSQTADTSHFGTCKLLLSNQNLRFYHPQLTELGPVGSFCLWELGGGGGCWWFHRRPCSESGTGPTSQLPGPSSFFLFLSQAELVSFPRCTHNTEQGNNEAAHLDKTCFPECHSVSLSCSWTVRSSSWLLGQQARGMTVN